MTDAIDAMDVIRTTRVQECRLCVFNRNLYSTAVLDGDPVSGHTVIFDQLAEGII